MTLFHAVVWIDHQTAQVLQFDAEHVEASRVRAHSHLSRRHGSAVRNEHEFYGHVCDAIAEIPEILVVGSHTGLADFRHYVEKHRAAITPRIRLMKNRLRRYWMPRRSRMRLIPAPPSR